MSLLGKDRNSSVSTPWGKAQTSRRIAFGITAYMTASHGGIKVSKSVLALMPQHLRNEDGWYEEDCEYLKVVRAFPHLFTPSLNKLYDQFFDDNGIFKHNGGIAL